MNSLFLPVFVLASLFNDLNFDLLYSFIFLGSIFVSLCVNVVCWLGISMFCVLMPDYQENCFHGYELIIFVRFSAIDLYTRQKTSVCLMSQFSMILVPVFWYMLCDIMPAYLLLVSVIMFCDVKSARVWLYFFICQDPKSVVLSMLILFLFVACLTLLLLKYSNFCIYSAK